MARDLFLLNRSRIIPNIYQENRWLQFNPDIGDRAKTLDLTYTQLRATSPIHVEYLQNMGVTATLTLSVVIENELWGLIACHHYSPKFVPYEIRKTGELIANTFAQRIVEINKREYNKKADYFRELEVDFLTTIGINSDISLQLLDSKYDLKELCNADGYAVIAEDMDIRSDGIVPNDDTLVEVKNWLQSSKLTRFFTTDHLAEQVPHLKIPGEVGGMVAICINPNEESFILWFKKSQIHSYSWGGDPNQPYEVDHLQNGQIRLSPRKSFEKWEEQVQTKSNPWDKIELDMAERIREGLLKKEVERKVMRSKSMEEDFEQLTFVASHDLQEPLRTVTNYLELLSEEADQDEQSSFKKYLAETNLAADRMKLLVRGILDYSRLGQDNKAEWISIQEVLDGLMIDMKMQISESEADIYYDNLPSIKGDLIEIRQLFQNLISNAIKYRKKTDTPQVHIQAKKLGNRWNFSVRDNGIGIEAKYHDKIFQLFKRLHGIHEYSGTGIGLAQCKKIMDGMDGKIWVSSEVGIGSTFSFSLHESIIKPHD